MANVLVPLAQGCEELEAVTIIDILRRAGIEVVTAGLDEQPVRASRGTVLVADTTLAEVQDRMFDMIVLPGGLPGADNLRDSTQLREMLKKNVAEHRPVAAICAAPRVLAAAGLLDNRRATSFPGSIEVDAIEGLRYVEDPVVIDGPVITSRGPGTAMDFALTLVEQLLGKQKRQEVEAPLQRPAA
jgi:4-methyl-5(b-hydroxyethyl)-thiazole monophosphate biosynthesis